MSYKFTKVPSDTNPYDDRSVAVELLKTEATVDELLEVFSDFLSACGFAKYTLEVVDEALEEKLLK